MPAYNSPFRPPVLLSKGVPCYLLGSFDYKVGRTKAYVTNVASTGGVGTVTLQILNGPLPTIGEYISILNATNAAFNVSRAIITAVTINTATGAGTVTFALAGTVVSVADTGTVLIEPTEVGETLVAGASIPCCVQAPEGDSQFTITTAVGFVGAFPTAVTVSLQEAVRDINAEYTTLTPVAATVTAGAFSPTGPGPVASFTLTRGNFYRFLVSGITGTGSIVAKIV